MPHKNRGEIITRQRRIEGHCIYCGARPTNPRAIACAAHRALLELDPHHCQDVRRPLNQPPDLPVLILERRAA